MNISVILAVVMAVASPAQKTHLQAKPTVEVVCHAPQTITVTVRKQKIFTSTYKLFDTQWEEVDTESPYEAIPDNMQMSNQQLQEKYNQMCVAKRHI